MDMLRTATDRFADEKIAPRIGLVTVFLIHKPRPCQYVANPVRSGNVFMDIFCHRSVKDVRNATRTSRMGIRTISTLTDELQVRYGRAMDIIYCCYLAVHLAKCNWGLSKPYVQDTIRNSKLYSTLH